MFVELHSHSAYSFLDGASLPEELAGAAAEMGYSAFALTDHNSVSGSMEFAQAAAGLGIRAIHGAEIDVDVSGFQCDDPSSTKRHLTLLVESARGWGSLCRILTHAHLHTRDPGEPEPLVSLELLCERAEGLICLSGCSREGVHDEATLRTLLEAFGPSNLRIELQRPFQRSDRALNRRLSWLAGQIGVPTVATGDIHAHARRRAALQDAFVALRTHQTLESSEPQRRGNWTHVLTTPQAMAARFTEYPEAVEETVLIAERCNFDLTQDLGYRYPGAEDSSASGRLAELCNQQFDLRYRPHECEPRARLEEELRLIEKLGLSGFFLLHHELLELAREVAVEVRGPDCARALLPPGRGRGSSVSSIVCYLTGLSHIDPIKNKLLLGRFLNEELTALPDIDLDFPRDIRRVLIPRIHERFGRERSALVAAFPTYRMRGAVRELGKVLGLPASDLERIARGAEPWGRGSIAEDIETIFGEKRGGRWEWLAQLCKEAYGLPRHLSQHPGGMIVSTRPLIDCCPILPAAMEGRQMVHWDKDSCADAGFLKIDLLGLGMLSAVERTVETIAKARGQLIDLSRIPFDDPKTFAAIQTADTMGVFQIESRAQMQSLLRTRPETLDDLTTQVAIIRPGPIRGGAINPFITRKEQLRSNPDYKVPYEHPSLEPVLKDTLGTIIFQDQVLEVAMAFAGFPPGEAEGLRRAMSRKRSEASMLAHHQSFIEGAMRLHGVTEEKAETVFQMIAGFSGFGFPKAHSAAFALLAYQSTWLRIHYPPEFLCGLLNEQPMGFYSSDTLIREAKRRRVELLPIDVNESESDCTVDGAGRVLLGLRYISGIKAAEIKALLGERSSQGPFRSLADLTARVAISSKSFEQLAWGGTLDGVPSGQGGLNVSLADRTSRSSGKSRGIKRDRRQSLWEIGVTPRAQKKSEWTQLALPLVFPNAPELNPLDAWETMLADYTTTGLTLNQHPIELLRPTFSAGTISSNELKEKRNRAKVKIAGMVLARQRPGTAKGMAFMLLEDEHGTINLVVTPAVYEEHRLLIRSEPLLMVEGWVEKHHQTALNIRVTGLTPIRPQTGDVGEVIELAQKEHSREDLKRDQPAVPNLDDFRTVAPAVQSFAAGRRR